MIYYCVFAVLGMLSFLDVKNITNRQEYTYRKIIFFSLIILLILFAGLRFDTGWDYQGYRKYYEKIPGILDFSDYIIASQSIYFEPGFKLVMGIAKSAGFSFYNFQLLVAFLSLAILWVTIKKMSTRFFILLFLYYSFCFLLLNMSFIRQGMAASVLLLAFFYYLQKRHVYFIFLVIFAASFHYSAILFLSFLALGRLRLSNSLICLLVGSSLVIYLLQIQWMSAVFSVISPMMTGSLQDKINIYLNSDRFGSGRTLGFGFFEKMFFLLLILRFNKLLDKCGEYVLFRNIFIAYVLIYFTFSEVTVIYDRLRLYFLFFNIFFLVILSFAFSERSRVIYFCFIIAYSSINFINIFSHEANRIVFVPYYSVLTPVTDIPVEDRGDNRVYRAILKDL